MILCLKQYLGKSLHIINPTLPNKIQTYIQCNPKLNIKKKKKNQLFNQNQKKKQKADLNLYKTSKTLKTWILQKKKKKNQKAKNSISE